MSVRRPPYSPVPLPTARGARHLVFQRDRGICAKCETEAHVWHCDHIYPLWLVDRQTTDCHKYWLIENMQTLCGPCHAMKTIREAANRAKIKRIISGVKTKMGQKKRKRVRRRAGIPF